MAIGSEGTPNKPASDRHCLKDRLEAALPTGFRCTARYIHSPPKPSESLFSPLPGKQPEKTRLASHFLTISVNSVSLGLDQCSEVISFAIEVLVFTTKRLTTIFVSKVDSTPYIPRFRPSPIQRIVTTFLQWLADEELRKRPRRKVVISLFARAQNQYLFPGSADDKTKHVLDDRQLIKWWARVLDPILPAARSDSTGDGDVKYQAYMTVPGCTGNELRSFMPPAAQGAARWLPGHPLEELARTRGIPEHAPPRCLLPRFPDDPKARYMQELDEEIGLSQESHVHVSPSKKKSGRWKSVTDLKRFWELMEIRQECSSGRVVGFLWLVISPKDLDTEDMSQESFNVDNTKSQDSSASIDQTASIGTASKRHATEISNRSAKKRRRKHLTGPIIPRQPRLKGGFAGLPSLPGRNEQTGEGVLVSKEGYTTAHHTMLNLDFSSLESAIRSSTKWIAEMRSTAGLKKDFGVAISGNAVAAANGAQPVTLAATAVNDLGGMIRKKRKATDHDDGIAAKVMEAPANGQEPVVNMLGDGTIRKKPKAVVQ